MRCCDVRTDATLNSSNLIDTVGRPDSYMGRPDGSLGSNVSDLESVQNLL
jgi:hypothetical protein